MAGYLGNPKLIAMTQDNIPVANFEYPVNPTASVNPVRVPVTWLNTTTGCKFICTDNTTDANVWKLMSGFRGALVRMDVAQTLTHNIAADVQFNAVEYDTDSFWNDTTKRFVVPSGVTKIRLFTCVRFAANTIGTRQVVFTKNGSTGWVPNINNQVTAQDSSFPSVQGNTPVFEVTAGQTFSARALQTSGGNLAIISETWGKSWFSIEVIE